MAIGHHGFPTLITALKIVPSSQHRNIVLVSLYIFYAGSLYILSWELLKGLCEQCIVVIAAFCIREAGHLTRCWFEKVKTSIQVGIARLADVNLPQQRDQTIV